MSNTKTTKAKANKDLIASPEPKKAAKKKTTTAKSLPDDIIGSNVPVTAPKEPAKPSSNRKVTVAIYSTKNVVWEGVGKVEKGYNIVPKAEADKWLTRNHVRLATPEEVAREYGA
jgi:hypothetical protein